MRDEVVSPTMRDQVSLVPLPAWVDHAPYADHEPETADPCVANGICRLLHDVQIDLSGDAPAWHVHHAQRVLTRAGAERAAHFLMEFNPAFQWLEIHFIRVRRNGSAIEHAQPGAIQTLRRETDLSRLVLNGALTASLIIPDVRVGDIVEVAATLYGSNPVLGRLYAGWLSFDLTDPWRETRRRVRRPLSRDVRFKPFNDPPEPQIAVTDGIEDRRWSLAGRPRVKPEDYAPPWLVIAPAVQVTEWTDWNALARLFAPLYDDEALPEELAQEIDRLAAAHPAPGDRAAEWLRYVQRYLRYFALALGEGGLVPRRVETIWTARFGDCKDMTQLYVAGARRMGLDACAALVSTTHSRGLDALLPSPGVFNHCIVRLRQDGKSYWLDPTMRRQSGSLTALDQAHSGWALPLTAETTALEATDASEPVHFLAVADEYELVRQMKQPAKFRRAITHFHWAADGLRTRLADEGKAAYAKDVLKRLQRDYPKIVEAVPVEIRDDPANNSVTAIFTYEIADCWRRHDMVVADFAVFDPVTRGELGPLETTKDRRAPIYLARPRKVTRHATIKLPYRYSRRGWTEAAEMPLVSYKDALSARTSTVTLDTELIVKGWVAEASEAEAYNKIVKKMAARRIKISVDRLFNWVVPQIVANVTVGFYVVSLFAVFLLFLFHKQLGF